jgi:hypothetical protein
MAEMEMPTELQTESLSIHPVSVFRTPRADPAQAKNLPKVSPALSPPPPHRAGTIVLRRTKQRWEKTQYLYERYHEHSARFTANGLISPKKVKRIKNPL